MDHKLKIWQPGKSWDTAEKEWNDGAHSQREKHPLKTLKVLPKMPGMTEETAKWLKIKSVKYLLSHDKERVFLRYFFKHPLKYTLRWVKSALKKKSYTRAGDFFFYGLSSKERFVEEAKKENTLLVTGFSYCHKPLECPSGRFTDACIHAADNPVCRQCFIGKTVHALPPPAKQDHPPVHSDDSLHRREAVCAYRIPSQ